MNEVSASLSLFLVPSENAVSMTVCSGGWILGGIGAESLLPVDEFQMFKLSVFCSSGDNSNCLDL